MSWHFTAGSRISGLTILFSLCSYLRSSVPVLFYTTSVRWAPPEGNHMWVPERSFIRSCGLVYNPAGISIWPRMVGWLVNNELERNWKWSWPNRGTIPMAASMDWGKPLTIQIRIAGAQPRFKASASQIQVWSALPLEPECSVAGKYLTTFQKNLH